MYSKKYKQQAIVEFEYLINDFDKIIDFIESERFNHIFNNKLKELSESGRYWLRIKFAFEYHNNGYRLAIYSDKDAVFSTKSRQNAYISDIISQNYSRLNNRYDEVISAINNKLHCRQDFHSEMQWNYAINGKVEDIGEANSTGWKIIPIEDKRRYI